jgi:hypothetical protein
VLKKNHIAINHIKTTDTYKQSKTSIPDGELAKLVYAVKALIKEISKLATGSLGDINNAVSIIKETKAYKGLKISVSDAALINLIVGKST